MLEGLAAWILNTYVGEYVQNLNTDQLSISLRTGAVELENLPLRKDALKNLDLPIEVKAGFIGKIRLQIPVRHLKSEPWVISIENLYLVAGPVKKAKYDPQKEDQHIQERKIQQITALEAQWKGKMQVATPEAGSSSWYAYSTSLLYNVLENLQLKIKDVHIRYEDSTTIPNESFAFGITMKSLSAQSTDDNWEPKIVQGQEGVMKFKLMEIENFSMYWDTDVAAYGDMDRKELMEALQRGMAKSKSSNEFKEHDYMLQPVSADAKLKRNGSQLPLRSRNTPRFICDIQLDKIPLSLSENQYRGLVSLAREFERADKAKLYRKWRPDCAIKENYKEWWKFAITSTLHTIQERNRKKSAKFFSERVSLLRHYVTAYTKYLVDEQDVPLSVSKVELEQMEKELSFEELRILRQVVYRQLEKRMQDGEEIFKKPEVDPNQQGVMQRWVWGWGSWYYGSPGAGESTEGVETDLDSIGTKPISPPPTIDEQEQQELMDVIGDPIADSTLLKRDHVFALLNFSLKGGSFQLCSSYTSSATTDPSAIRTLVELEFAGVDMSLESRLRTSSMLFTASLGSLYIRDVMTKGSLFPVLVSPQQKREETASQQQQQRGNFGLLSRTGVSSYMAQAAAYQRQTSAKEQALFEMSYESNPPNSNADCSLQITTRPMDMVYNPTAIQRISDFFNSDSKGRGLSSRGSELQLTRAARLRYEELKNQTKQELRQTLDGLLEGEHAEGKRWAIDLDISAPQIIIPDSFHSKEATLVVLDFGHLQLFSATAKSNKGKREEQKEMEQDQDEDGDLDDDFATPLSTPPNEIISDSPTSLTSQSQPPDVLSLDSIEFGSALTETALRQRMYDRYQLDMSDLQVLVGKATDNWRMAHTKGSCHMQVIEKFTISVQLERRLNFTTDPQWPSATVAGNLPSLSIHINEKKIQALNTCLKLLLGPEDSPSATLPRVDLIKIDRAVSRAHTTSISEFEATFTQRTQALLEESKLLEMQVSVGQVSLEVQSRGRCIAECQVYGVNGNLCKRPYDTSVSLSVHGLLLIDALQQFGQDFELLLASHKDLSMHAPSGSIVDSETSTPRSIQSPMSPQSPASPSEKMMESASQPDFASAISRMGTSVSGTSIDMDQIRTPKYQIPAIAEDSEALITVDIDLLSANCPSNTNGNEPMQIATVQFNSLDVIANQETIVELLAFFKRAFPEDEKLRNKDKTKTKLTSSGLTGEPSILEMETSSGTKTEVTANFRCLNLVLVRAVKDPKQIIGRKVATVTLSDAHVWGTLGDNLQVEGSLGGLQLLDLTPNSKNQKIFSVGQDPAVGDETSKTGIPPNIGENDTVDFYRTAIELPASGQTNVADVAEEKENKALTFTLSKGDRVNTPVPIKRPADFSTSGRLDSKISCVNATDLDLHLASLCYTHVPRFLKELTMSLDEFHSTAEALADSIQKAATEVAMEFVRQKSEYKTMTMSTNMFSSFDNESFSAIDTTLEDTTDGMSLRSDMRAKQSEFNFKMVMETPIIVLPRLESSLEVLVAHLGKILITNSKTKDNSDATFEDESMNSNNRLYLSVKDMNMFSFNHLDSKSRTGSSASYLEFNPDRWQNYKGTPILDNTSLELIIDRIPHEPPVMVSDYSSTTLGTDDSINTIDEDSATIQVHGRIVSPLKIILSKHVYEQVIQTVDNLTYAEDITLNAVLPTSPLIGSSNLDSLFATLIKEDNDSTSPLDLPSTPMSVSSHTSIEGNSDLSTKIKAKFDLPEFSVQLQGDLSDGDQGLVDVSFKNFSLNFEKLTPYTTSINVTLQSIVMEDLLQESSSKHRYLIVSRETSHDSFFSKTFLSTSLPSIASLPSPISFRPASLPSSLASSPGHQYNSQLGLRTSSSLSHRAKMSPKEDAYPSTPPPSLDASMENIVEELTDTASKNDALVRIRVMLVDKKCPNFEKKYKKVNRFVEVDFNTLDTTLNVQTWVVLLDFLGVGGSKPDKSAAKVHETESLQRIQESDDDANTEIQIQLKSLSLILNKPEYELAKAQVSDITAHLMLMDGNIDLSGRLGNISLLDLTPHGKIYKERFTTKGEEALSFKIFKYGQPDLDLRREFDLSVRLRMSSVRYIHTNRFQSEVVAFAQHFSQLQDMLSRMRAASAGHQIQEGPNRSSRISLNIEAGSPVILAPVSSRSKNLLVINLGNLTLKNRFLFAGEDGTIAKVPSKVDRGDSQGKGNQRFSTTPMEEGERRVTKENERSITFDKPVQASSPETPDSAYHTSQSSCSLDDTRDLLRHCCLLDCMYIDLNDMDLYSAERIEHDDFQATDVTALIFTSFVISRKEGGRLLKETCVLKLQVERNLDADISRAVPDICITGKLSSVHCSLDTPQYQLIRGMLDHNFGEQIEEFQDGQLKQQSPMTQTVLSGHVWTNISLNIDLVNVTVELLNSQQQDTTPEQSLGQFDFIQSKLSIETFSDGSKTIDLTSHAIRASDTRWKVPSQRMPSNAFWEVLTPSRHHSRNPNPLQMEIHYASTPDHTKATVLLNNMRVICVMDLILAVKDFLLEYDAKMVHGVGSSRRQHPSGGSSASSSKPPSSHSSATYIPEGRSGTPVSIGAGIITKRAAPPQQDEKTIEVKVNITETEFVVLENTAAADSNAVILKASCAVLKYNPERRDNPLTCSLQELEVFSCCMGPNEAATALSIIDPVTVSVELKSNSTHMLYGRTTGGLLDVMDVHRSLEIHIQTLINVRVSYNDAMLFLAIMNSLPAQILKNDADGQAEEEMEQTAIAKGKDVDPEKFRKRQVPKLQELGFSKSDCEKALRESKYQLDQAASWLLENAQPIATSLSPKHKQCEQDEESGGTFEIAGVEVRAGSVSVCLIDDCRDSDVPLCEISLQGMHFFQKLVPNLQGSANFTLMADYYNRKLSGWEPFLEPWKCNLEWMHQEKTQLYPEKLFVQMKVNERLDLNLTSALMELYASTKKAWTEDYGNKDEVDGSARRRSPFVPYALRNHTGCTLWFSTLTSTPNRISTPCDPDSPVNSAGAWVKVYPGEEMQFIFEEKGKHRHRHTHVLRVHQLLVRVEGWDQVEPVSVDKVGVYFRLAKPQTNQVSTIFSVQHPARVVFEVTLEGTARKVVTVRSALRLVSRLSIPMELKLVNEQSHTDAPIVLPMLEPNCSCSIPLTHTNWQVYVRPHSWGVGFCERAIQWQEVERPKAMVSQSMECKAAGSYDEGIFRFVAYIKHEAYPPDSARTQSNSSRTRALIQPGHTITLLPSMVLTNILPYELNYEVKKTKMRGTILPGKDQPLYAADLNHGMDINFFTENYPECPMTLVVPAKMTTEGYGSVILKDSHPKKRHLVLKARVECRAERSLKILITAPYWLINKSGLPLIFKQEGADYEAAGQFDEHERARSVTPFMFSYTDFEKQQMCTMRLGRGGASGTPYWCTKISLEGGTGMRTLRVHQQGGRPQMVYHIGIDIRQGRGRYRDTKIVTFVPRFQLENRSSCKLAFAQRHLVQGLGVTNPAEYLSVMPGSSVIFHWPRDDLDRLLCIRMASDSRCRWSGGIRIDKPGSLNINMRSNNSLQSNIMHVEVNLRGATFFVVFNDYNDIPPPYRIDNLSEVDVLFYQSKVVDMSLRTIVRAKASCAYSWDEPVLPPQLTVGVKGGSSGNYNLDKLEEGEKLYYENFIYIAMTHTFASDSQQPVLHDSTASQSQDSYKTAQLVFDIDTSKPDRSVVLRSKEPGRRSQLWRMTTTGMLQSEAFIPPREPRKTPKTPSVTSDMLVLDIAELTANPQKQIPLVLRKADERRTATQTWFFDVDGKLHCHIGGLVVQALNGIQGLTNGGEVVLGPTHFTLKNSLPVEQAIERQKNLPGSGSLVCKVIADGPTRVLQITDLWANQHQPLVKSVPGSSSGHKDDWLLVSSKDGKSTSTKRQRVSSLSDAVDEKDTKKDIEMVVWLRDGVGLSLVNHLFEELLYITLTGIDVHYLESSGEINLNAGINNIQIDNQATALKPVTLFALKEDEKSPAVSLAVTKLLTTTNAVDIYKRLIVTFCKMTVTIEEILILQLLQFAGMAQEESGVEKMDENHYESLRSTLTKTQAKRYFVDTLKINATEFKLSVLTSPKLPPELQRLKKYQGLFLVQFEDAPVSLDPYTRLHAFETQQFLVDSVTKHYHEELKSQALKLLGSMDFLGNPIGLIQDIQDGLKELIMEFNVSGLAKNFTHGLSNTAAKVTGSLSDGLGTVTMDSRHKDVRHAIKASNDGSSSGHLKAGLKGFTFGVVGGLTSVFSQTYRGVTEDGVMEGFFPGVIKGVIGTVTKPTAGFLDLASGTMAALRSTTSNSSHNMPPKVRLPRCCANPAGMLPRFSRFDAKGLEYVQKLCEGGKTERYFAVDTLREPSDGMQVLITSECTYFLSVSDSLDPVLKVTHMELYHASYLLERGRHYIEVTRKASTELGIQSQSGIATKERPRVRCDNERIAKKVSQQINYAKSCYEEHKQQVHTDNQDENLRLELPGISYTT